MPNTKTDKSSYIRHINTAQFFFLFLFFAGAGVGLGGSPCEKIINQLTKWSLKEIAGDAYFATPQCLSKRLYPSCSPPQKKKIHRLYLKPKPCIRRNDIVENFHNLFVWHFKTCGDVMRLFGPLQNYCKKNFTKEMRVESLYKKLWTLPVALAEGSLEGWL